VIMTPLAQRITKELTLPLKDRTFNDEAGLLSRLDDVHCFEVSEVFVLAEQMVSDLEKRGEWLDDYAFLPAPKTWMEINTELGRIGWLMEQREGSDSIILRLANSQKSNAQIEHLWSGKSAGLNAVVGGEYSRHRRLIIALLAMINTPRLLGRKQHMPHRGLERRLAKAKGLVGKFPLHAWTELKLSISDIGKRADGTEHEAHYTGEKCLHFCRTHLRVRNGRLERVSAHWRGNPALGIKRTRYKLAS